VHHVSTCACHRDFRAQIFPFYFLSMGRTLDLSSSDQGQSVSISVSSAFKDEEKRISAKINAAIQAPNGKVNHVIFGFTKLLLCCIPSLKSFSDHYLTRCAEIRIGGRVQIWGAVHTICFYNYVISCLNGSNSPERV